MVPSEKYPRYSHESPHGGDISQEERNMLSHEIEVALLTRFPDNTYQNRHLREYAKQVIAQGSREQLSAVAEIILSEEFHGNKIPEMLGKWGVSDRYEKTRQFIGIAVHEPELAHAIVANNVGGFHGSNSSSLLGVLEHGILSSRDARDRHVVLGSGERTYTDHSRRPFISFADWRAPETLGHYANGGIEHPLTIDDYQQRIQDVQQAVDDAEQQWGEHHPFTINGRLAIEDTKRVIEVLESNPDSLASQLLSANFPVLYGIDISEYDRATIAAGAGDELVLVERVSSDVQGEFVIVNGAVTPENIPIIAVPQDRVAMVRQLVSEAGYGIDVYPVDALIQCHR